MRVALRHKRGRRASRTACRREASHDSGGQKRSFRLLPTGRGGEQSVVFRLTPACVPSHI
ncbi:hypothetical protein PMA4326_024520 [Pseudomonas syringae pv. maculicola str. ES4326]|uniref:DUF1534 domain-containing protein n=1 Tax=Pseudomonas syringae pv. maculicola str. ES4326 TaxID=629265 RepID=A0A8T8C7Z2_PSEYM|nr:hypothetical protein PMA4326_024520 [Pseudomonas syringae pv. maculicola str. ES4326]